MEQKKFDINSLIGFILLGAIGMYWIYTNQPTPEELEKAKTERIQDSINKVQQESFIPVAEAQKTIEVVSDSINLLNAQNNLGSFANSAAISSETTTVIENEFLSNPCSLIISI